MWNPGERSRTGRPKTATAEGARTRVSALALSVALIGFALAGCDAPLAVDLPGEIESGELNDPSLASLLVRSVQGDFECAFDNYVWATGLLSAELVGTQGGLTAIPYVQRDVRPVHTGYGENECDSSVGLYTPLSTARWFADDTFERISDFSDAEVPDRAQLLGQLALWSAFSRTLFGETFCRATFDQGPALTPAEVLVQAEALFTTVIDLATQAGDDETLNAAYVGRARVLLDLGMTVEAAVDAGRVPNGFEKVVTRSSATNRRENQIYDQNNVGSGITIDPQWWDVTWQGVPDPRVSVFNTGGLAGDQVSPLWQQTKYTSLGSPYRLASYVEAQLIIAEVEGGQVAVGIINDLHGAAGIPLFQSNDAQVIREHVIMEREREFYLEGRHMADLRRYPERDFATVASHGGQHPWQGLPYGSAECFPLPNAELSANPNVS